MTKPLITIARRGSIITESTFKGYDYCLNPYVGCQFGCNYCYVRFFIKDPKRPWGEFVRTRDHIADRLPRELPTIAGQRLVIGTMTDPYQPQERTSRLTRTALEMIVALENKPDKVGIFTRSPIVLDDIDLIAKLPRPRVHFSITPFPREIMVKIEQIPVQTRKRWDCIKKLKDAGIRVHVNVAPAIPHLSDTMTEEFCDRLAEYKVDEYFVDPMQAYSNSFDALREAMTGHPLWPQVSDTMLNRENYDAWKERYRKEWKAAWAKKGNPAGTLAIWCDHISHVWNDLVTGNELNPRIYGDDLVLDDAI
jgi:DNA repair photolyase